MNLGLTFVEYKNRMKLRRDVLRSRLEAMSEEDPTRYVVQKQLREIESLIGSIEERRIQ